MSVLYTAHSFAQVFSADSSNNKLVVLFLCVFFLIYGNSVVFGKLDSLLGSNKNDILVIKEVKKIIRDY